MATIGKYGKVLFSEDEIQFLKDNFKLMTNKQIAAALQLKPTIVRMKAYELGLQKDGTRMLLTPDSDFFRYFKNPAGAVPAAPASPAR